MTANRREKFAKYVMARTGRIAIAMVVLAVVSVYLSATLNRIADPDTRWLVLSCIMVLTAIQGASVACLFWSRMVVRNGQGKL